MWAHPGIDLHLSTHPESRAEVEGIAGRDADIRLAGQRSASR
jgi:hypothetical protein